MAELIINKKAIQENIIKLGDFFKQQDIKWSLITKVFSGDKRFIRNVLSWDVLQHIDSVGDSRLSSLKNLREVHPEMHTIYIKPPATIYADEVVKYANVSLNSSIETIQALNEEAKKANKVHNIIIMIEMGELREGVNQEDGLDFYEKVSSLSNIYVEGIGSNLGCMYGIVPSKDKFNALLDIKKQIKDKFGKEIDLVSAGTSITLPFLQNGEISKSINHYRVGEAAFFGVTPLKNEAFLDLNTETFEFKANIIELEEKKLVPEGTISDANIGHVADFEDHKPTSSSHKAILDFGLVDVEQDNLSLKGNEEVKFVGTTSDMTVIDIGDNLNEDGSPKFKVGDTLNFSTNYMAVCRLLGSKFVTKTYRD